MKLSLVTISCLGLLALLLTPVLAHAGSTYSIPLYGARWNALTITVSVPDEPAWAHQITIDAMEIWNSAQRWFMGVYFPRSHVYTFIEQVNGKVRINFETQPVPCGDITATGCTYNYYSTDRRIILSSKVEVNISSISRNGTFLHELGHVLGLDHTNVEGDLMNRQIYGAPLPSTLDLYGLHVLAEDRVPSNNLVTLPNEIKYQKSEVAIPEFSVSVLILVATFCVSISVSGRVGRRGRLREPRTRLFPG